MAKKEEAPKAPVRSYLAWTGKRACITPEKLETLKKDQPEAILERNSVRPDRIQIDGRWYALELPEDDGRRYLVALKPH